MRAGFAKVFPAAPKSAKRLAPPARTGGDGAGAPCQATGGEHHGVAPVSTVRGNMAEPCYADEQHRVPFRAVIRDGHAVTDHTRTRAGIFRRECR